MMPLGDDLGADQHVVAVRRHRLGELGGGARPGQRVADHQRGARRRETASATSSLRRSTPGPHGTRVPAARHSGHNAGTGTE